MSAADLIPGFPSNVQQHAPTSKVTVDVKMTDASNSSVKKSSKNGPPSKKRKLDAQNSNSHGSNAPSSTVIVNTVVESTKKKKDPSPRSLLTMWIQLKNYDVTHKTNDWANFKEEHPTIYLMLKGRERNGGSEFEGGRRFNKLLRATWKYIHGKDPIALEEAILIATPTPRKKKARAEKKVEEEKGEEGEADDEETEDGDDDDD